MSGFGAVCYAFPVMLSIEKMKKTYFSHKFFEIVEINSEIGTF